MKLGSQCKEKDIKSGGLKDQYSPATMLAAGKFKNYIKTIKKSENGKIEVRFSYWKTILTVFLRVKKKNKLRKRKMKFKEITQCFKISKFEISKAPLGDQEKEDFIERGKEKFV